MINSDYPLRSLQQGNWLKLICGASFQHLPSVRNLTLAYALSGVDCIDVSADAAVIASAQAALKVASLMTKAAQNRGYGIKQLPWLMVSLNAGEDPHFRKAAFDSTNCPPECDRPCEPICPAQAIVFERLEDDFSGVLEPNCYGCGRCLPICPSQLINVHSYVVQKEAIASLVLSQGVDAVEIHTQVGQYAEFANLWSSVKPWVSKLKLVAISCPDGEGLIDYLWSIYKLISPLQNALIWQTDGRPMSGDIGDGTTIAAVKLAQKVLKAKLPGYVQLAGGTNRYTVPKLQKLGMLGTNLEGSRIAGVAYGSYARTLLSPILERLEQLQNNKTNEVSTVGLEQEPQLLWEAVNMAQTLVSQLKPIAC